MRADVARKRRAVVVPVVNTKIIAGNAAVDEQIDFVFPVQESYFGICLGGGVNMEKIFVVRGEDDRHSITRLADTQDFGILRIICEDPDKANEVLREGGFLTTTTKVLAAPISDEPGSLASILEVLSESNVMVEYTYAFLSEKHGAYMILRVDDNQMAAAALAGAGIKTVDQADLF